MKTGPELAHAPNARSTLAEYDGAMLCTRTRCADRHHRAGLKGTADTMGQGWSYAASSRCALGVERTEEA